MNEEKIFVMRGEGRKGRKGRKGGRGEGKEGEGERGAEMKREEE